MGVGHTAGSAGRRTLPPLFPLPSRRGAGGNTFMMFEGDPPMKIRTHTVKEFDQAQGPGSAIIQVAGDKGGEAFVPPPADSSLGWCCPSLMLTGSGLYVGQSIPRGLHMRLLCAPVGGSQGPPARKGATEAAAAHRADRPLAGSAWWRRRGH